MTASHLEAFLCDVELAGSRVLQLYQWRLPEVSGQ